MKRTVSLLLSAALLLGMLSACQGLGAESEPPASSSDAETEWTVSGLANLAFDYSGREDMDGLERLDAEMNRDELTVYIENAYGLEAPWEDAAVVRATGASAFEITVLRMADSDAAARAGIALMSYIFTRQGDFAGYAPAEVDMVANGSIMQDGPFAALFICPDPDGAYRAVEAALNGESLPEPRPSTPADAITDLKELRDYLVSYCGMEGADLEKLDDSDPDALASYIEENYGLAREQWMECAIARGTGDSAFEVAVMTGANDWTASTEVKKCLDRYLDGREGLFQDDMGQKAMLYQATSFSAVSSSMEYSYLVLLACEDAKQTALAFDNAAGACGITFSERHRKDPNYPGRCRFIPPNKDDMSIYDTSAILAAWEKDDPAELSKYDRDIYDQAKKVLNKVLKSGMSDYEKEVAVYEWVVWNIDYDWTHQNILENTPRESFTPYGGLVNRAAVCLGYATTFHLLMELAGVECITVPGAAYSSQDDHGWNMVRLSGEWYCVDVTWDANMREQLGRGRQEDWDYFNVSSDYMADTDHQWDYANTPEATAVDKGQR